MQLTFSWNISRGSRPLTTAPSVFQIQMPHIIFVSGASHRLITFRRYVLLVSKGILLRNNCPTIWTPSGSFRVVLSMFMCGTISLDSPPCVFDGCVCASTWVLVIFQTVIRCPQVAHQPCALSLPFPCYFLPKQRACSQANIAVTPRS